MSMETRRRLTLFDATCIMVGIVVGSGIFRTPAGVAAASDSAVMLYALWLAGGVASLLGTLCFAELSTRYPEDGGMYAFLHRAYGAPMSFLFAWTDFWIVRPANAGAVALILGQYANEAVPVRGGPLMYAVAAVVLTTGTHLCGLHAGRWSQNVMSVAKVVGLLLVVVAGFSLAGVSHAPAPTTSSSSNLSWLQAWVFVMFCFGGWADLSAVAAEVRSPERNMLRALVLGILAITGLYLLVNAAALSSLGLAGLGSSPAMVAEIAENWLANLGVRAAGWGERFAGMLVTIACLSSLSGVVFTGARIYFALGQQESGFAWLGSWDPRRHTPSRSLIAQAVVSCLLLLVAGQTDNGFERLVLFAGPCYWGFTLLTTLAVVRLRRTDQSTPLQFRTPGYPWLPLVFAAISAVLVYSSVDYLLNSWAAETWYSLVVLGCGVGMALWVGRRSN